MIREIGDRLTLVGVAHVLPRSVEDVEEAIMEREPEVVGVELCPARYFELTSGPGDERTGGTGFSREALLAKILRSFQERIGERTGVFPGEEMQAAILKAHEIGAEVKLIDRDIDRTLRRLMDRMSFWEKLKIFLQILLSFFWIGEELDLEKLTEGEAVEELLRSLKHFSETAYDVLIEERNKYMADQITGLLDSNVERILCVVGAGHVPGLSEELDTLFDDENFGRWR